MATKFGKLVAYVEVKGPQEVTFLSDQLVTKGHVTN